MVVPKDPDPILASYLRGGQKLVAKTVLFQLIHEGYLKLENKLGIFGAKYTITQVPPKNAAFRLRFDSPNNLSSVSLFPEAKCNFKTGGY